MNSKGILFYNTSTNTVTLKPSSSLSLYPFDKFTHDTGNNYYIEANTKTNNKSIMYYNDTDQTIKLVGWYV